MHNDKDRDHTILYYYRDKDAKEIDLVLEQGGVLNPIEIKKSANPGSEQTKAFHLLDKSSTPRGTTCRWACMTTCPAAAPSGKPAVSVTPQALSEATGIPLVPSDR